jgi:hypothetical protein
VNCQLNFHAKTGEKIARGEQISRKLIAYLHDLNEFKGLQKQVSTPLKKLKTRADITKNF